jgi:predicted transcriptional regulator
MARRVSETLTEREAQIMQIIWPLDEVTAEQVRLALPDAPHDSTVRTLLRVLVAKGYLTQKMHGKGYVYRAKVARQKAQIRALRDLVLRLFGGSAQDLVLRLIEDEQLTPEQLEDMRRSNPPAKQRRRGKGGEV